MKDPVILPSSRVVVDRPVIQRHLLSDTVRENLNISKLFFFSCISLGKKKLTIA